MLLLRQTFGIRCVVCNPSFISSNDGVEKFIPIEFVVPHKLLPNLHLIQRVLVCQLLWDPSHGQFPISEDFYDDFV